MEGEGSVNTTVRAGTKTMYEVTLDGEVVSAFDICKCPQVCITVAFGTHPTEAEVAAARALPTPGMAARLQTDRALFGRILRQIGESTAAAAVETAPDIDSVIAILRPVGESLIDSGRLPDALMLLTALTVRGER